MTAKRRGLIVREDDAQPAPVARNTGGDRPVRQLTLYSRSHCTLCAAMLSELLTLESRYTFALERIDIDEDPSLVARFNAKVPVLAVDGEPLCCHFLDTSALIDELTSND